MHNVCNCLLIGHLSHAQAFSAAFVIPRFSAREGTSGAKAGSFVPGGKPGNKASYGKCLVRSSK